MNHHIIYSHGFGVRQDDRGLFTDIAATIPNARHIMFDYNQVDELSGNLTVPALNEQAERLSRTITDTHASNPNAMIDLICHSQGCVVAALSKLLGIRKIVLTAPPTQLSTEDMVQLFVNRPGSEINLNGMSRLKRADFSITNVPTEYWESIKNVDPVALYNKLSQVTQLLIITATEDEVLVKTDFSRLSSDTRIIKIKAGHNFEKNSRDQLIHFIKKELFNE